MERHFEIELERLNKRVMKMGTLVSQQITNTMQALLNCDADLAAQIIANDVFVDRLDVKIDKLCQRIFALTQPVATDLRFIMSALKMNNDLERMGDHAVGIAEKIEGLSDYPGIVSELNMTELINQVEIIVRDVINILTSRNTTFVKDIFSAAASIEEKSQEIASRIMEEMMKKTDVIVVATNLMVILTHLERIAGYSTNIAESVVFIVEGQVIKHKKPE
jgi:phosphate transport system protein